MHASFREGFEKVARKGVITTGIEGLKNFVGHAAESAAPAGAKLVASTEPQGAKQLYRNLDREQRIANKTKATVKKAPAQPQQQQAPQKFTIKRPIVQPTATFQAQTSKPMPQYLMREGQALPEGSVGYMPAQHKQAPTFKNVEQPPAPAPAGTGNISKRVRTKPKQKNPAQEQTQQEPAKQETAKQEPAKQQSSGWGPAVAAGVGGAVLGASAGYLAGSSNQKPPAQGGYEYH